MRSERRGGIGKNKRLKLLLPPFRLSLNLTLRSVGIEVPVESTRLEVRVGVVAQGGSLKGIASIAFASIALLFFVLQTKNEKIAFGGFFVFLVLLCTMIFS